MTQPADTPGPAARLRLVFTGSVQGVGFRATARQIARGFDVSGWVRNEADGTVTLEAQGSPLEVERFLTSLHERMGRAVKRTDREAIPAVSGESGFEIRR
jgi:acylphosphatase